MKRILLTLTLAIVALCAAAEDNPLQKAFVGLSYVGEPAKIDAPTSMLHANHLESASVLMWSSITAPQKQIINDTLDQLPSDMLLADFTSDEDTVHIWASNPGGMGEFLVAVEGSETVIVWGRGDTSDLKNIITFD